jgi:hypothetical protein
VTPRASATSLPAPFSLPLPRPAALAQPLHARARTRAHTLSRASSSLILDMTSQIEAELTSISWHTRPSPGNVASHRLHPPPAAATAPHSTALSRSISLSLCRRHTYLLTPHKHISPALKIRLYTLNNLVGI